MKNRIVLIAAMIFAALGMTASGAFAADKPGCKPPGWAQPRLPGFDIDSCSARNWATVDLDLKPTARTIFGHRDIVSFQLVDQTKISPAARTRDFYIQLAQKQGAKLVSDPKNIEYAALEAKTPKADVWYILQHSGPDETTRAYSLTTLYVLPMPIQGQGQAMKAALDTQAACSSPPWYVKAIAHFTVDSCDNRIWDSIQVDTAKATQTLEGARTTVSYKLDAEVNGVPSVVFQKDFIAIFKAMGATIVSDPGRLEQVVATQKTPAGTFWYYAQHYGDDDTTASFALTTMQIMPDPQFVQLQPMKAALDTQTTACTDPPWVVKQFPQYKASSCDNLVRDSVSVDIKGGTKTLEGARTAVSYALTDDKKVETALGAQRNFLVAFQAMGATIVSDPANDNTVVATQKLPQGEFWYIYLHTGGNSGATGSYSLTTVQITAFDREVTVQPMTAALAMPVKCSDPPWLVKQFPQYKVDSCDARQWDVVPIDLPAGHQDLEGARTSVTYSLTDNKKNLTAATVQKNYVEAFKAIGIQLASDPASADLAVFAEKTPAGGFWMKYEHGSGNSESTGTYTLTTVQITPFPQVVVAQPMPNGLEPQSKPPCKNPTWLVKQFDYFALSQCSYRDFDSIDVDLPAGKKTLAGRILVTDFTLSDQNQGATKLYIYRNYLTALQGIGATLVSDPNDKNRAVFTQKTPQGEFWYIYTHSSGNDEATGSYELTTVQIGGPPPKTCTLEIYGVNFDFNKATLRPESDTVLQQVLALFNADPTYAAEVGGHTDNIGTESYNMKLSGARAEAVKTWLVAHGVAAARLTTHGYGDTKPLVPNTTDANRFKNRRVELKRNNCK
jgi:outer membrane protein OmpA-like peptidoglycan-associated protein